jgi:uroporphyrinogen-III decarboxylase
MNFFLRLFGVRAEAIIGQVFRPENHPDSPPVTFGRLAGRETGTERQAVDSNPSLLERLSCPEHVFSTMTATV